MVLRLPCSRVDHGRYLLQRFDVNQEHGAKAEATRHPLARNLNRDYLERGCARLSRARRRSRGCRSKCEQIRDD
jgi:hypothetical protein